MAGAYVDSLWINALFPPPDIKGQRVQELTLQTSDEGAPINRCHGEMTRCAGTVVWLTDLTETKNSNSASKGGQGGNFVTWSYSLSMRVAICQEGCDIRRIYADSKLLFDADRVPSDTTGSDIAGTIVSWTATTPGGSPFGPVNSISVYKSWLVLTAPAGGTDLSVFVVGKPATLSGFTGGAASNNGSQNTVVTSKVNADGSTKVTLLREYRSVWDPSLGADPNPPASSFYFVAFSAAAYTVTISQAVSVVGWLEKTVDSIRFYDGSSDQPQDALEVALLGSDLVPAYRGITSVLIEGLQLVDFGNRPPILSFVMRNGQTLTVGDMIADEFEARGLGPEFYDSSRLTMDLGGYTIRGPQSIPTALSPVMIAYNIVARENAGRFEFYTRDDVPEYAPTSELLGAFSSSAGSNGNPCVFDVQRSDGIPNEVTFNFADPENNYLAGTERAVIEADGESRVETVDTTITMDRDAAARVAKRLLWSSQVASTKYRLAFPISEWGNITESMLLTVTINEVERELLVQRVERRPDGIVEAIAVEENQALYATIDGEELAPSESLSGGGGGTGTQFISFGNPPVEAVVVNLAPLRDEHASGIFIYVGAGPYDSSSAWGGAALFESSDDTTFTQVARIDSPLSHGYTTTQLSTWSGAAGSWDDSSTVTVSMFYGELENCTDDECLAGKNRMLVGSELVGFTSAESTGTDNEYTVSGLLRGLRNTEGVEHSADGERVVLVSEPGLHAHALNSAAIGSTRFYKVLHSGQTIDDVESVAIGITGASATPFSPDHIEVSRDASNNATLTWVPRSRAISRLLSGQRVPNFEPVEGYVVEIYSDDTFATLLREIAVDEPEAVYTATQQTSDGLTPGDPITVRVYQVGSIIRRGNAAEATL